MAASIVPTYRRPPAIYRVARALRWTGIIVLVLLIIYAGSVAYSAYEVAHASIQSRSLSAVSVQNGVIQISGSFTLSNPGIYPIAGLALSASVANDSGVHLGAVSVGPETIAGHSSALFPIVISLPIAGSDAAESLLFEDQYIEVAAWANVTYAYLFPLAVTLLETRSWGAPFEGFQATVGRPVLNNNGTVSVPVTVSFSNHASFLEDGALTFTVESAGQATCGGGSFPIDVPPGDSYDQTQDATLSTGCSPVGGELLSSFTIDGSTTSLPPEPIP